MTVADLDFADDICLMDDNFEDAQTLLDKVVKFAAKAGIEINVPKTKYCSNIIEKPLECYGQELEQVDKFTYLGSKIRIDANITQEVRARIGKATGNARNLKISGD